jgi:hypothetical protein
MSEIPVRWHVIRTTRTVTRAVHPGYIGSPSYQCAETTEKRVLQVRFAGEWRDVPEFTTELDERDPPPGIESIEINDDVRAGAQALLDSFTFPTVK